MRTNAVLVYSGGPDTLVLYKYLKSKGWNLYPILVNASYPGSFIRKLKSNASSGGVRNLTTFDFPIKGLDVSQIAQRKIDYGYIFYVVALYAIACLFALSKRAKYVLNANHKEDRSRFNPSERSILREYHGLFSRAVKFSSPFGRMTKAEVFRLGHRLGVPFEYSWSCTASFRVHCGHCASCGARKKAFRRAKIRDPTRYRD